MPYALFFAIFTFFFLRGVAAGKLSPPEGKDRPKNAKMLYTCRTPMV